MSIYLILICVLFLLAFIDLIVGVSNDAVNFLNSAIGSKAASFRTILIVASLGILLGASFSSGMMEVARKGIFNPAFFTFDKVMIVFLAVMLTDIILLDFYNTLGLPTSTTVSLVFALLGGALVTGLLIAFDNGYGLDKWREIINFSSAVTI
ncbi:MAG: inorganic phosphate transporter, partial [Cyclobacteriaceae bacterium]|nr:inorganic phosphate transporter [Cyclobacteriaceae bacterium]